MKKSKNVMIRCFQNLLGIFILMALLVPPVHAQGSATGGEIKKAAAFYLELTCASYHNADYVWDPAVTVAKMEGLDSKKSIPKDLKQVMKDSARLDQDFGKKLTAYKWPNEGITNAVGRVAQGFFNDAKDINSIVKANSFRAPNWSMWWRDDDEIRKLLGIKPGSACPGWPMEEEGAFRYLSAVCPTRRAYSNFLNAKDLAARQGMTVGDPIPKFLAEAMLTSANYYERSGYQLWDLDTPNKRVKALARRLAEREYSDADQVRAVVRSGRWREPAWVTDYAGIVREIRSELGLPPADPDGCPA